MISAEYADRLIQGIDLWEDPWTPPDMELQPGMPPPAVIFAGGGLWGIFVAATCWWAYEFVMAGEAATVLAQIN